MFAKETCFLLQQLYALFQLLLIIAHLIPRPRCNQSFLLEGSATLYPEACAHPAAPICRAAQGSAGLWLAGPCRSLSYLLGVGAACEVRAGWGSKEVCL